MRLEVMLDRIEEGFAVLTDKNAGVHICDASLLPEGAADGATLYAVLDSEGHITSIEERNVPAEMKNKRRLSSLFLKNPKNKNKI